MHAQSNSASNSADHDIVWRELEDIDTSASVPNTHKDIDQLQVHLNGELVLPDALILDSTIPFDLVDIPLIKHEELPLELPLDNNKVPNIANSIANQSVTPTQSPSSQDPPSSVQHQPPTPTSALNNSEVQATVAVAAANVNVNTNTTPTTSAGVNKPMSVVKQESKTEPTFAVQPATATASVTMQGRTQTGAPTSASTGTSTGVPAGSPTSISAQAPVRSVVSGVGTVARRARPGGMSVMMGRVEKRVPCTLKEKREREARQFPRALLTSLDGTTSAEVRKMSAEERELVLYKRKLRNRESARRSRQKRQAALADLQDEIGELQSCAAGLVDTALKLRNDNQNLRDSLEKVQAENRALRAVVDANREAQAQAQVSTTPTTSSCLPSHNLNHSSSTRNDARLGA